MHLRRVRSAAHRKLASYLYFRGPAIMSEIRKRWVLLRHPHVSLSFGRGTYLGPRFSIHAPSGGTFTTGTNVEFRRDFRAELDGPGSRITIGDSSVFTYDVTIQCGTSIDIGDRCVFAQAVMLVDGSHRFRDTSRPMLHQGYDYRPLRIANDSAVMSKSTIIADLGERAFIAANAVVTRPVPACSVAAGVPAKIIDTFGDSAELTTAD